MSEHRRVRLRVSGRVQGVGFRRFVERSGEALGLAGWVRNGPDGSVELEVEGDPDDIDSLRANVKRGPPTAIVRDVVEVPAHPGPPLPRPFAVRYD